MTDLKAGDVVRINCLDIKVEGLSWKDMRKEFLRGGSHVEVHEGTVLNFGAGFAFRNYNHDGFATWDWQPRELRTVVVESQNGEIGVVLPNEDFLPLNLLNESMAEVISVP